MAIFVAKDISLAHQMTEDVIGRGLMPAKSIEWESLSFSSGASGCGHLLENCSVDPHEDIRGHRITSSSRNPAKLFINGPSYIISEEQWYATAVVGGLISQNRLIGTFLTASKKIMKKIWVIFQHDLAPMLC